jgi:hypothetical protein
LASCSSTWAQAAAAFDSSWPDVLAVARYATQQYSSNIISATTAQQCQAGTSTRGSRTARSSSSSSSTAEAARASGAPAAVDVGALYADALQLCRALVAAAPLPLVCNNLICDNLAGLSEAGAAGKVCAGCRCRYCSAACQAADWRRHKRACRRMAAQGQGCS